MALHQQGQLVLAQHIYSEILRQEPRNFDALHLLGVAAAQSSNPAKALELILRAIRIAPGNAAARVNCGLAEMQLGRSIAALASFEQAIALDPHLPDAHFNRGLILQQQVHCDAALESFERAIALRANFPKAHYHRGLMLRQLNRLQAALASFNAAIEISPEHPEAYSSRGNLLQDLKQYEAAVASYDRAIALKPQFAEAYFNRANALRNLKRFALAVDSYDRARALGYDSHYLDGLRLFTKMHHCDWRDFAPELAQLLDNAAALVNPFCVMVCSGSAEMQLRAAKSWAKTACPHSEPVPPVAVDEHRRIRIGYFSADFLNHPVAVLTAELFELHDRAVLELFAFSYGPDTQDSLRVRLEKAFDHFIDVRERSDQEIAALARSHGIDIAVDLGGFTTGARPQIFSFRAAPVQVSYLGYLGSMGAPFMDYLIADATIIPADSQRFYSEKILYLPSYQVNDTQRQISSDPLSREQCGLPAEGFAFCCFNGNYKITPDTFAGWMRILKRVPGSTLLLYAASAAVEANLRREAEKYGVDGHRLVFADWLPHPQHLARCRVADLFLDTLPYNAGTTASDALWAGLPVITCLGEAFSSRVAASLLMAVGLPELVTDNAQQYEDLAVQLATDRPKLETIRRKLAENRLTTPLFDTRRFARSLENGYLQIHRRCRAGLAPEHTFATEG